jgi:hypothetical protein
MRPHRPANTRPGRAVTALLLLVLALLAGPTPAARAQQVVYVSGEPEADSLRLWTTQAMADFRLNQGDSAGGPNYRAYEKVGLIGRRLLRAQGRRDLLLAPAIRPTLDSLGFATEIATDPASPTFALLMVRDPLHPLAEAVGFLYWLREADLRLQGVVFRGGHHPRMRVWWSGKSEYPYEWGVLDETPARVQRFTLLRLAPTGASWAIQQDEEFHRALDTTGEAQWADLNGDERPELVSWAPAVTDSLFAECASCPHLITERTFIEGRDAFELQDERLLPTSYATLVLFVRLLLDGQLVQAEKLVRDPARVRDAVAQGWNRRVVRTPWRVEHGEQGETWPRRLELRFEGPQGVKRYGVVFGRRDGRWIIENWFEPRTVERHFPSATIPPARPSRTRPPVRPPQPATPPVRTR